MTLPVGHQLWNHTPQFAHDTLVLPYPLICTCHFASSITANLQMSLCLFHIRQFAHVTLVLGWWSWSKNDFIGWTSALQSYPPICTCHFASSISASFRCHLGSWVGLVLKNDYQLSSGIISANLLMPLYFFHICQFAHDTSYPPICT